MTVRGVTTQIGDSRFLGLTGVYKWRTQGAAPGAGSGFVGLAEVD
jgi:hypothetical protein